jgi:hypothetical protein
MPDHLPAGDRGGMDPAPVPYLILINRHLGAGHDRKGLEVGAVSELQGIGRFKFHEAGKLEEFKRLSAQAMEIVRVKDTGTLRPQALAPLGRLRRPGCTAPDDTGPASYLAAWCPHAARRGGAGW